MTVMAGEVTRSTRKFLIINTKDCYMTMSHIQQELTNIVFEINGKLEYSTMTFLSYIVIN